MDSKNNTVAVTNTNTIAKTGHGILKAVYITISGNRVFSIYDGTSGSGELLFTIEATTGNHFLSYINVPVRDGLFINVDSGTTGNLLVLYE